MRDGVHVGNGPMPDLAARTFGRGIKVVAVDDRRHFGHRTGKARFFNVGGQGVEPSDSGAPASTKLTSNIVGHSFPVT